MDPGLIAALIVAVTLAFVGACAGGVFFGLWWQARKTAEVWEKTYTHLREQLTPRVINTYNTRGEDATTAPPHRAADAARTVMRVPADMQPPPTPVVASTAAQRLADTFEDDPLAPQVRR